MNELKQALAVAALLLPTFAFSQDVPVSFQPEPDFELGVSKAIAAVKPADAFDAASECRVVDARFVKPVAIEQAEKMLAECLTALSTKYSVDLTARRGTVTREDSFTAQVQVLMIMVPKSIAASSPLMRDLNHGLAARQNRLFGHKAVIERSDDRTVSILNAPAQEALDGCLMPTVLRKIESGADFIKHYGSCLRQSSRLGIKDLRQSPAHQYAVIVLSGAERPVVAALTGPVKVLGSNGQVEIQLLAYSEPVYLP